ncbi:zinc-dependent alcohol dehydrogenase family protein [Thermoflavifilum thermophilum]|uniref:Alcohol dehydrogenase, propanol-preferring n=1 Tax=Thermoflavifilum thermophilum TaxID=1393122 RepID=A0A1I7NE70_9BACT|nr:zinc-dependent alcohol dehydrogenase family protein [Thermoflavifilum thermophilum]SFV32952.1 alcohol dehydrogenase, propanol-preferring [Thermoflavifilum thermophilum]
MKAMVLHEVGKPLQEEQWPVPEPGPDEVLVRVIACGVCRTDLHVVDGELPDPLLPLIPGHEIIGQVEALGTDVTRWQIGDWVGIPWLGYTCGHCVYCQKGMENLCERAQFTGYTRQGGYAEYTVVHQDYAFALPENCRRPEMAPLLCAGLIGFRSYRMIHPSARRIGLYGFGAAAHILTQIASHQGKEIYAFTRDGDQAGQRFARRMGAYWAGGSSDLPPVRLDAAILFAPVGTLIPQALQAVDKGGQVICGGIHMSDIPSFPYRWLWEERNIQSVANLTREDGEAFFATIQHIPIHTEVSFYPLSQANRALADLKAGHIKGAAVLRMEK